SLKIVKSLISMCRNMGLESVIEGGETKEELETIRELGGTLVQGYFFSKPVSGTEAFKQLQGVNACENEVNVISLIEGTVGTCYKPGAVSQTIGAIRL
ncbi:MAG: EAL domain-containing protein, partial [Alphaproteobacteria bacterium]